MSYRLLNEELVEQIVDASKEEQALWLVLSPHPDSLVHWLVNSLHAEFYFEFEDLIGEYRAVGIDTLDEFMSQADKLGYHIVFEEDPTSLLEAEEILDAPPPFELNSPLPDTIGGFLPFQLREFNRLKDKEYGLAVWSTGTGKTVLASALVRYHEDDFDLALVCVKQHNKINTQRKMEKLAGVQSNLVNGPPKWRERIYEQILKKMESDESVVMVLNYEKFKDDFVDWYKDSKDDSWPILNDLGRALFENRHVLIVWDEMPMKLKNRSSLLYKAVCHCLYDTKPPQVRMDKRRPEQMWQYMLSATPIEQSPEDVFNCLRLMDGARTFGTVKEFRQEYVERYSFFDRFTPDKWHHIAKMHLKIAHCTSLVDKEHDPEIAAMFPDMIEEPLYIEWSDQDRKVYDMITGKIESALELGEEVNPLALMTVLQMMCNAPSMLNESARKREKFEDGLLDFLESDADMNNIPTAEGSEIAMEIIDKLGDLTNDYCRKLEDGLKFLITERHPNEKILVFTVFADMLLPILSEYLDNIGISHVVYAGTDLQKQAALDNFKSSPNIRVFLSSDAGSDSIDLEEASVSIDYDFPWAYSRKIQRRNRTNRVTSQFQTNYNYSLIMANSVEERRIKRIALKLGYHEGMFYGVSEKEVKQIRLDKGDLYYIITGHEYS